MTKAAYRELKSSITLSILELNNSSESTQEPLNTALLKCSDGGLPFSSVFLVAFSLSKHSSISYIPLENAQLSPLTKMLYFTPSKYSFPQIQATHAM